ncbi:unnamed protein product [Diplocarpon coronariae]
MTLSFVETEKIQRSTRVAERLTSHDVTIRQKRRDTIQQSMAWTHAQDEGRIACQSRSTRLDWKDEGEKLDPVRQRAGGGSGVTAHFVLHI